MRMFMKAAIYIGTEHMRSDERLSLLIAELEHSGCSTYFVRTGETLQDGTDVLLSVGGDGTFLYAALLAASNCVPVAGGDSFLRIGWRRLQTHCPQAGIPLKRGPCSRQL